MIFFFALSVCFFNSLPKGKFSAPLITATFSYSPFSGKPSSPVTNSYLQTLSDDNAKDVAVGMSKTDLALFCYRLSKIKELSDGKAVSFTKNEYSSLV